MKRVLTLVLIAGLLGMSLNVQAASKRITIATAGTAGALYPMGVAMAETINRHAKGYGASAEASAASLENIRNLATGKIDWGISQNEVGWLSYSGQDKWKGRAVSSLRSLFGTLIGWMQIFAPADSPLKTVADFRGKRIGVGAPGSGGEQAARKVLAFYGLDYKKIKAEFISDTEMVAALKDGTLDAFISTHPLRSAAMLDLTTNFKVKMIPLAEEAFYKKHPYFSKKTVPAGTYRGLDSPVATSTSRVVMYTSSKAPLNGEDVYNLLKAVWENAPEWTQTHPAVKRNTTLKQALSGVRVPLHAGALRYYREKGLTIAGRLIK